MADTVPQSTILFVSLQRNTTQSEANGGRSNQPEAGVFQQFEGVVSTREIVRDLVLVLFYVPLKTGSRFSANTSSFLMPKASCKAATTHRLQPR